jgi:prepilin-type N-terminal cleavage/methylation domain-containing protein
MNYCRKIYDLGSRIFRYNMPKTSKKSVVNRKFPFLNHGFTLVELLIVMAILALMARFLFALAPGPLRRGRDARRQSDLKQYQTLLEAFASVTRGLYPSRTVLIRPSQMCVGGTDACGSDPNPLAASNCPEDPSTGTYEYRYLSDGTSCPNNTATQFVLWAYQESTARYYIICSNGKTGTDTVAPATSTCPATLVQ